MAKGVTFENFLRLTASKEDKTGSGSWPLSLTRVRAASPLYRCLLQCVAVCCSVLQCVRGPCRSLEYAWLCLSVGVLQCVAVCCSVLQFAAVCCSVLQ